jgi:hypothetical protein
VVGVIREAALDIFDVLKVVGICIALFYVLLVASFVVAVVAERRHRRRVERLRFQQTQRLASDFRRELDSVDLAEELRRGGRAA